MPVMSKTVDAENLQSSFGYFHSRSIQKVDKLAGDASTRQYYRLHEMSTTSYVLQVSEPFLPNNPHPFLCAQKILQSIQIPVPEVLEVNAAQGWILLSDLGDVTLQQVPSLHLYRQAIDLLLRWSWKAHSNQQKIDVELRQKAPHFEWSFDLEKLQFEMAFTEEHLIKKFLGRTENFSQMTEHNSRFLADRPRVFCHRDYHSRNLMVHNNKLYVIDFQDARMGPCTYDLVSLLWDPYIQLSNEWKKDLFFYWLSSAQNLKIPGADEESLKEELERMKIQRLMKAAGSYASFFNKKGRKDYLPYIVPALLETEASLHMLKTLGSFVSEDEKILTLIQELRSEIPAIIKQ